MTYLTQAFEYQATIFGRNVSKMVRDIPRLLQIVRTSKGLSQEGVADSVKISPSAYGRYERGENKPTFEFILKLVQFYGITLDEFYHFGEARVIVKSQAVDQELEIESLREQLHLTKQLLESKDKLLNEYRRSNVKRSQASEL